MLQLRPQLSDVQLLVRELLRRCEQSESGAIQTLLRLRLRVAHGALQRAQAGGQLGLPIGVARAADEFGCGGWCRRALVGDEIGNRGVGLVTHTADGRQAAFENRVRDFRLVKRP